MIAVNSIAFTEAEYISALINGITRNVEPPPCDSLVSQDMSNSFPSSIFVEMIPDSTLHYKVPKYHLLTRGHRWDLDSHFTGFWSFNVIASLYRHGVRNVLTITDNLGVMPGIQWYKEKIQKYTNKTYNEYHNGAMEFKKKCFRANNLCRDERSEIRHYLKNSFSFQQYDYADLFSNDGPDILEFILQKKLSQPWKDNLKGRVSYNKNIEAIIDKYRYSPCGQNVWLVN